VRLEIFERRSIPLLGFDRSLTSDFEHHGLSHLFSKMAKSTLALSLLALAGSSLAQVSFGTGKGIVAGRCSGQSCDAADVAGITGNLPRGKPKGGS
jgi:RNase P/RNase MRP subunit POP5